MTKIISGNFTNKSINKESILNNKNLKNERTLLLVGAESVLSSSHESFLTVLGIEPGGQPLKPCGGDGPTGNWGGMGADFLTALMGTPGPLLLPFLDIIPAINDLCKES